MTATDPRPALAPAAEALAAAYVQNIDAAHLPEPAAAPLEVRLRWERGRVLPWRKEICRKAEDTRIRAEAIRIEPQLRLNPKPSPRPTSRGPAYRDFTKF